MGILISGLPLPDSPYRGHADEGSEITPLLMPRGGGTVGALAAVRWRPTSSRASTGWRWAYLRTMAFLDPEVAGESSSIPPRSCQPALPAAAGIVLWPAQQSRTEHSFFFLLRMKIYSQRLKKEGLILPDAGVCLQFFFLAKRLLPSRVGVPPCQFSGRSSPSRQPVDSPLPQIMGPNQQVIKVELPQYPTVPHPHPQNPKPAPQYPTHI